MHTIQQSTKGLGLVVDMAWDRFLFVGAIGVALVAASHIGYFTIPAGF